MGLKLSALLTGVFRRHVGPGVSFLTYHRVVGDQPLELDLPYRLFESHLKYLRGHFDVIAYEEALELLRAGKAPEREKCVITFDDGFRDVYTKAFPLLKRFNMPATVFVTTAFIDEGVTYPLIGFVPLQKMLPPVTWDMLREMRDSGLVTIGAHTHTHPELPNVPSAGVREEFEKSNELIYRNLGFEPTHFAYPRARWDARTEEIVKQYYETAAIVGGKKAMAQSFTPHRIPRLPMRRSDGLLFFKFRLKGLLQDEELIYEILRRHMAETARTRSAKGPMASFPLGGADPQSKRNR